MTTADRYVRERRHAKLTPGKSLRIVRELQGLSQAELANLSGVPQPTISAIESGRKGLGVERARQLAEALSVHPAVLAFPGWEAPVVDLFDAHQRRLRPHGSQQRRKAR